jgi:hypothetical protein
VSRPREEYLDGRRAQLLHSRPDLSPALTWLLARGQEPAILGVEAGQSRSIPVGHPVMKRVRYHVDFGNGHRSFPWCLNGPGAPCAWPLLAYASVEPLAQQVGVTHVAGVLLDHSD